MKNAGRNLMTPYGDLLWSDFEALEAEVEMMLGFSWLPKQKRTELNKRMEAIRGKAGALQPQ
jgi:hypothetical protein